jgi:hypothetical protein
MHTLRSALLLLVVIGANTVDIEPGGNVKAGEKEGGPAGHNNSIPTHNYVATIHNHTRVPHTHTRIAHNHMRVPHNHTRIAHNHTRVPHNHETID